MATLNWQNVETRSMALEMVRECPNCGEERTFYRSAAMFLHLGHKTKWSCPDCDYGFVMVDGEIDTGLDGEIDTGRA